MYSENWCVYSKQRKSVLRVYLFILFFQILKIMKLNVLEKFNMVFFSGFINTIFDFILPE